MVDRDDVDAAIFRELADKLIASATKLREVTTPPLKSGWELKAASMMAKFSLDGKETMHKLKTHRVEAQLQQQFKRRRPSDDEVDTSYSGDEL